MFEGKDGFPLSNYPMFSREKQRTARIYHVVGFAADGQARPMRPTLLGTDEIMQASQTAKLAVAGGRGAAKDLCKRVASRVVESDAVEPRVVSLQVRVDVFDAVAYWDGERKPKHARVVARCRVEWSASP